MGTVREYFDTEVRHVSKNEIWSFHDRAGSSFGDIQVKAPLNYEANATYYCIYVPNTTYSATNMKALITDPRLRRSPAQALIPGTRMGSPQPSFSLRMSSETLIYTKHVILYIDADLSVVQKKEIEELGARSNLIVSIRDRNYAKRQTELEVPLAFISHDSRDKDALVRDLARGMSRRMCPVWYDEYSLKIGDDLRENIERGLKSCKYCIIIISSNFITNKGWTKNEFDSIYIREIIEKKNFILPIWHGVSTEAVFAYCPMLTNRFALNSSIGADELARKIVDKVKGSP